MRGRFTAEAPVGFVLPEESTIGVPWIMDLVANGPDPENGKRVLDFALFDEGQQTCANTHLRPVRAIVALPSD